MAPPLLCIMGPTAAGKTDLAITLAEQCNAELISVDSALVYRDLNIGAAKPDYPHHLIDIRDPSEPYSAADFARDAHAAIIDIRSRGRHPILIGGTMLYYRALLSGLDDIPATDLDVRKRIEARAAAEGWPALHAELARVDPVLASRLHPNHSQRISRGLEIWQMTGRPLSDWQQGEKHEIVLGDVMALAVCPSDRQVLHKRIADRFDVMVEQGLIDEVRKLHERKDLNVGLPSIRAVGYRQLWAWLDGEVTWEEAQSNALAATRQLAKRQLTWLRKWPNLTWLLTDDAGVLSRVEGETGAGNINWSNVVTDNGKNIPLSSSKSLLSALKEWFGELS